jgi:GDP-L-fucose synthase
MVLPMAAAAPCAAGAAVKVLVTGGTGLVGRALREHVGADARFVFAGSRDGDLRSELEADILFNRVKPTHVVHLAARTGGTFSVRADSAAFMMDNVRVHTNVLGACRKFGVRRVVTALSTCAFPDGVAPAPGADMHAGPPHPADEGAAYAQRALHVMARHLAAQTGVAHACLVFPNLYGPHDAFDPATARLVPALIHGALHGDVLRVRGTGAARRQFVYSRDAAALILHALDDDTLGRDGAPVVVAPPESSAVSVRALATMVKILSGCPAIEFDGDAGADGRLDRTATCGDAAALPPGFRFTSLQDGLEATMAWYIDRVRHLSQRLRRF